MSQLPHPITISRTLASSSSFLGIDASCITYDCGCPAHEEGLGAHSGRELTWHVYQISVRPVKQQGAKGSTYCTPKVTCEEHA